MSEENVEVVRAIYERWKQGDYSTVDWADPEIEFVMETPGGGTWRGLEAMRSSWREFPRAWQDLRSVAEEIINTGDKVLALHEFRGRGRESGLPIRGMRGAALFTFEGLGSCDSSCLLTRTQPSKQKESQATVLVGCRLTQDCHCERFGRTKRLRLKEKTLMKLFLISLVAACALMAAMATSAVASTDGHFPEINPVGGATACASISGTPAVNTGSNSGLANKSALLNDACLGG